MAVFLFPGQGSQTVGMGRDLYDEYPEVKRLYDKAVEILGFNLRQASFEGPDDALRQTNITQPALFVHSVALDMLMKQKGLKPEATAGHSLGEYSALVSAEAMNFEDALSVVKVRGEEMARAGVRAPGGMAAIIGADSSRIEEICRKASAEGIVVPANLNSPGQVVLSGELNGIEAAVIIAKELGVRRAVMLKVSGAFHSPLMAPAREPLAAALAMVSLVDPKVPVYQNVSAEAVTTAEVIHENLLAQLESPVQWESTIRNFGAAGFDQFYEVGAGNVLNGLNRRILADATTTSVNSAATLAQINV